MRFSRIAGMALVGATVAAIASPAQGQGDGNVSLEARGIAMVPTFDIADAADVGPGFGVGLGYQVNPQFRLMADLDVGFHPTAADDVTINTYHLMGKLGFDVFNNGTVTVTLNAGAGALQFAGDLPQSQTYFAINAGAKIGIAVSPVVEVLISPQGDIAFASEDDLGTTNAWVWPFGAGLRFRF